MPMTAYRILTSFLCLVVLGCYSPERNLSLDPFNKPLIHILESKYDQNLGQVVIKWEYIGNKAVSAFEVQRRITDAFEVAARVDGQTAQTDYVQTGYFSDEALLAGESIFYQVAAKLANGGQELTPVVSVTIPGARAQGLTRDPVRLATLFRWQPDLNVATGYEVYRTVEGAPERLVFQTADPTASSFLDEDITSNLPHHYFVQTLTQSGRPLKSRPITAQFYRFGTTQPVETVLPGAERLRLSVGEPSTMGGTLALVSRINQLSLYQFRYQIGLTFDGSPRILRVLQGISFPEAPGFDPLSVDLAGPLTAPTTSLFPKLFIGGIRTNGQVEVVGYEVPLFNTVWSLPEAWQAPTGANRVVISRDNQERVFVAVGNELRVFSEFGSQVGLALPNGDVQDMSVHNNQICMLFEDHRLALGTLSFDQGTLQPIVLQSVSLGRDALPVAVAHNSLGQIVVLNAGTQTLLLMQSDASKLLEFSLPMGEYATGDITIDQSAGNLLQVTDGRGDLTTFIP